MKSSVRCSICDKNLSKLYIQMYTCKCKNIFCDKHKLKHDCSVNYRELFKQQNKINVHEIGSISKNKIEYI